MDERISQLTNSYSATSPAKSQLLLVFGCLNIVIWRLESSTDCLRLIGVGRTDMSSYAVIIGRGFPRRKLVGILPEFVGLGRLPHHLVCVFLLIVCFICYQFMTCLVFFVSCSFRLFVVELCVEREDFKDLRH